MSGEMLAYSIRTLALYGPDVLAAWVYERTSERDNLRSEIEIANAYNKKLQQTLTLKDHIVKTREYDLKDTQLSLTKTCEMLRDANDELAKCKVLLEREASGYRQMADALVDANDERDALRNELADERENSARLMIERDASETALRRGMRDERSEAS